MGDDSNPLGGPWISLPDPAGRQMTSTRALRLSGACVPSMCGDTAALLSLDWSPPLLGAVNYIEPPYLLFHHIIYSLYHMLKSL